MKRVNLLPNFITAFGLTCGLFVIFRVNMTGESTYVLLHHMTLILLVAALADLLDGAIARLIKAESEFGLMFDSLADAISFGVAPSVFLLKALSLEQKSPLAFYALAGSMLYTLCGVLRLVRFNLKAQQSKQDDAAKKVFVGLPIPAAAAFTISPILFFNSPLVQEVFELSQLAQGILFPSIMILCGYLMVSRLRFPSLKTIHFRLPSFPLLLFATLLAIFILYGIFYYLSIVLLVFSWGYALLGLLLSLIRRISGRKTKVLEDFETSNGEED
ncbi:MAG: CDP-alcohol phosphatidyltransferase family protein [Verrucomicrobia bacterium]|nr:CDP-alcohol phosphatidyltransferase family protein [Verrucomicrobiota bacterium]